MWQTKYALAVPRNLGSGSVIVAVISELLTVLYLVFVHLEFFPILASSCCHLVFSRAVKAISSLGVRSP